MFFFGGGGGGRRSLDVCRVSTKVGKAIVLELNGLLH